MTNKKVFIIVAVAFASILIGIVIAKEPAQGLTEYFSVNAMVSGQDKPELECNEDHDHNEHEVAGTADKDHDEHAHESVVLLSVADTKKFGIEIGSAGAGEFDVHITVPGEITFNANKLAHIVPTVPGIVRQVVKDIGDSVVAGEVVAWLESTELGQAKVEYLTKQAEMFCCSIELTRAKEIHDNTLKLLETLKSSPSLETLRKTNGSAMGMNRSLLVSAYAEFIFAKEAYLRESDLFEKKISSKEDSLKAQRNSKKAEAQYIAVKDSVGFKVRRDFMEAKRTQYLRDIELKAAEQILYVLGLTAEDVKVLTASAKTPSLSVTENQQECSDPNCKECVAKAKAKDQDISAADSLMTNQKLAWYPIRAPFAGTIINKHITLGEVVGNDAEIFVIADLSSVWVDLHVYQKDLALIKKGQKVIISAGQNMQDVEGVISYVSPIVEQKSRTALARVVLDNTSKQFRPGSFVTANVLVENRKAKLVVSRDIIQDVDDTSCVFVQNGHGFEARPVTVGWSNKSKVEIVSGLKAGEKIVTKNSFRLKAELEKVAGSGCGHAH